MLAFRSNRWTRHSVLAWVDMVTHEPVRPVKLSEYPTVKNAIDNGSIAGTISLDGRKCFSCEVQQSLLLPTQTFKEGAE